MVEKGEVKVVVVVVVGLPEEGAEKVEEEVDGLLEEAVEDGQVVVEVVVDGRVVEEVVEDGMKVEDRRTGGER